MALLIALSALFGGASQAPLTAPSQALTYEAPSVTTQPAPKAPEAPTQALSQAPETPPTQAPRCEEDMPCWDCHTMGNLICGNEAPQAPAVDRCEEDEPCWDCKTMGNLICGPIATEAHVQAPVAEDAAVDAWDSFDHVRASFPGYETKVEFTGTTNNAAAPMQPTEFMIPSINFPNTFHIFKITYLPLHAA
jgi:hypothetical protein